MKIRLNLATSPLESNRSFVAGAALVGGLGVLAMLVLSLACLYRLAYQYRITCGRDQDRSGYEPPAGAARKH